MIKLIATDLDGTLLSSNKIISSKTKEVLKQAKDEGIYIVPCTGRPLASITPYLEELELFDDDYSITFNGGLVQHNQSGTTICSAKLSDEEVSEIISFLNHEQMTYDLVANRTLYAHCNQEETFYEHLNCHLDIERFSSAPKMEYNKIVVTSDEATLNEWIPKLTEQFAGRFYIVRTMPQLFEIASLNARKDKGVIHLCQHLNIPLSDVVAFGDEANDIELLQNVGLGIAMANATDEVKAVADAVTKTNDEHGVALAIEALLERRD